ncbi:hypothetical protein RHGRI_001198 [Rhododendron griersonianum]|uniref:Uncharacterized protein n=1 Tax=Rhododendron griersonianum TaxID=479676 RepID=A0AAV6LLU2_9ERIC|nr:hypothetical protein RHGRI_001198 [Rhododendron griersonianum]
MPFPPPPPPYYSLHRCMKISRPIPTAPHDVRRFHFDDHTHARNLKRFNVDEDCSVFDGFFPFCQATIALPSHALPLVTNNGGATITNDALPPVTNDDDKSSPPPFPDRGPPARRQDPHRVVPSALPSSSTIITGSSPPPDSSAGVVGDRFDIVVVSGFVDGTQQDDDRIGRYVWVLNFMLIVFLD